MVDDPQESQEEQPPEEGQSGFIEGVERTPEVDETLREYGIDPDSPEEKKEEETPTAPPSEQPETPPITPAEEPAAPVETKETEEEVEISETDAQSLIEKQTGEKKGEDEEYPWEKEKREPTEKEVLDYVAQKSADIQEQRRVDADRQKQDTESKQLEGYKNMWKDNISFLESNNYIPKVTKQDDPNDAGMKARVILHEQAVLHNELDLEKVYWRYAKPLIEGKQPPGANAPITTQINANTEKENDDDYYYDEIHGKDPSRDFDAVELEK